MEKMEPGQLVEIDKILSKLHPFSVKGCYLVFDPGSLRLFKLSEKAWFYLNNRISDINQKTNPLTGESDGIIEKLVRQLEKHRLADSIQQPVETGNDSFTVCLVLTHQCNLNCVYCYDKAARQRSGSKIIRFEDAKQAIDEAVNRFERVLIWFFGGEPLLEFELIRKIVAYCESVQQHRNKLIRFTITTNGTLLNPEILDYFVAHQFHLMISADTYDTVLDTQRPASQSGVMGTVSSKLILAGLKLAASYQHQLPGFAVRITVTRNMIHKLTDSFWAFRSFGVKEIGFSPASGPDPAYRLTDEDVQNWCCQLESLISSIMEVGGDENIKALPQLNGVFQMLDRGIPGTPGCGIGRYQCAVDLDGTRYACHRYLTKGLFRLELDHLTSDDPRITQMYQPNPMMVCDPCWAKTTCAGKFCPYTCEEFTGSPNLPYEPFCKIQKYWLELSFWAYMRAVQNKQLSSV